MPRSVALYVLLVCACAVTVVLADNQLRITAFYDDLPSTIASGTTPYCTKAGDTVTDRKSGGIVQCTADDVMSDKKIGELKKAVAAATAMHISYLNVVTPSAATGIKFPTSDVRCTHFLISYDHRTQPITGADFALFVAASPMEENVQVSGTWCGEAALPTTRPEVGAVNIAPKHFTKNNTALTRLVAREILVGLGFSLNIFNKDGSVTTIDVRDKTGVPAAKGTKVLEAAKKHFGCDSMAGVELEYVDEASKVPLQYWRGRVMKDDLMAPNQTAGYYTAVTIAAMVDTGYYTATTATAEDMPWGRNAGCTFINNKCIGSDGKAIGDMFCTGDTTYLSCTTDRLALGTCDILSEITNLPDIYKYFAGTTRGGAQISMDYCPVFAPANTKTHCSTTDSNMPYSVFGENARCLDLQSAAGPYADKQMHGLCADIQCNAADSTYMVKVKGATAAVSCSAGATVDVDISTATEKKTGKLQCPAYADVCALPHITPTPDSSSSLSSSSPPPPNDGAVMTATRSMSWVAACLVAVLLACV